jgi:hypothetical protein
METLLWIALLIAYGTLNFVLATMLARIGGSEKDSLLRMQSRAIDSCMVEIARLRRLLAERREERPHLTDDADWWKDG